MNAISSFLCGVAMAATLSFPALAGGKSNTGAATTAPTPVTAATIRPKVKFTFVVSQGITSSEVANLIATLKSDFSSATGVSEDDLDIQVTTDN